MIFNPFSIINSLIHGLTMYQIYVQHFVIIICHIKSITLQRALRNWYIFFTTAYYNQKRLRSTFHTETV